MKDFFATLRPAIVSTLVFMALLGVAYPVLVGGIATLIWPDQARGSLIHDSSGRIIGSELVGQPFTDPAYVWGRPTAIGYNAMTSSGTNAGPSGFVDAYGTIGPNPTLVAAVNARVQALRDADPTNTSRIPIDLVTASASGLDPHISPAAAYYQAPRVARARHLAESQVRAVIDDHIEERTLGVLGERRVNVLLLDQALDATFGSPSIGSRGAPLSGEDAFVNERGGREHAWASSRSGTNSGADGCSIASCRSRSVANAPARVA